MINLKATCSDSTSSNESTVCKDTSGCKTTIKDNSWSSTTWSNDDSTLRDRHTTWSNDDSTIISESWGLTTWSNYNSAIRDRVRVEDLFRLRFNSISRVV